jgi:hypothetical protein
MMMHTVRRREYVIIMQEVFKENEGISTGEDWEFGIGRPLL